MVALHVRTARMAVVQKYGPCASHLARELFGGPSKIGLLISISLSGSLWGNAAAGAGSLRTVTDADPSPQATR